MSLLSGKKLLLLGFFLVLLIAVPVAFYFVSQQTTKISTEKATILSLSPTTQNTTVDSVVTFDINVDPSGKNQVSFLKLLLSYDATKLATTEAGLKVSPWATSEGTSVTPVVLSGPTYAEGTIEVTVSTGEDAQNAIKQLTKIATVDFRAIAPTEPGTPSSVIFGNQTQVLSAGALDEGESANVLLSTSIGSVNIEGITPTESPTPTFILVPTETLSASPTATISPTETEGLSSDNSTILTPTLIPEGLVCSSLTADPGLTGTAPFPVNLTAIATSSDSTINSVYFDFGDGTFKNVTESGGLGSYSISVLTNHTYQASGTFNAIVTVTDESGNTNSGNCTATIIVSDASGSAALTPVPSPLPPTGPTGIFAIGAIGIFLAIIGVILLFSL